MLLFCVFMRGQGVHQRCGQSGAVKPFPASAGAASALNGVLSTLVAFAMANALACQSEVSLHPLTNGLGVWSVCIAVTAATDVQRRGAALIE